MGWFCDALETDNRIALGVIFREFDGAEYVIDGNWNLHDRKRGLVPKQLRRAAARDDTVIDTYVSSL